MPPRARRDASATGSRRPGRTKQDVEPYLISSHAASMNHDVIVIGASAGGVEVLLALAQHLPVNLPASLFVTLHSSPVHPSLMPELMSKRGPLPATHPLDGEKIQLGQIYIAPPDNHLTLAPGVMHVARGPKENGHRPAVDALFRTAAAAYGSRVIGVVLTGYGDCGTAGLLSVKARGGLAVVQQPDSAHAREMPVSALNSVKVDHIVTPQQLPELLTQLVSTPAGPKHEPDHFVLQLEGQERGEVSGLVCPICQGSLQEAKSGKFQHLRCHVGHTFSTQALIKEQRESLERALWAATRALEESAGLSKRLSLMEHGELRERFAEKARTQRAEADIIREILLHGTLLSNANETLA